MFADYVCHGWDYAGKLPYVRAVTVLTFKASGDIPIMETETASP
jgi:hypothetical protein